MTLMFKMTQVPKSEEGIFFKDSNLNTSPDLFKFQANWNLLWIDKLSMTD